jgi:hypothetical protein
MQHFRLDEDSCTWMWQLLRHHRHGHLTVEVGKVHALQRLKKFGNAAGNRYESNPNGAMALLNHSGCVSRLCRTTRQRSSLPHHPTTGGVRTEPYARFLRWWNERELFTPSLARRRADVGKRLFLDGADALGLCYNPMVNWKDLHYFSSECYRD